MKHIKTPVSHNRMGCIGDANGIALVSGYGRIVNLDMIDEIVQACNSFDDLLAACQAATRYDKAIRACADDPDRMSSYCTAQGQDLDSLYFEWITKARDAIKQVEGSQ